MRFIPQQLRHSGLVAILLVGYLLLSLLVYEQGRIIDNQKSLIHQLFADSLVLHTIQAQNVRSHAR